jgi:hypothetical protein
MAHIFPKKTFRNKEIAIKSDFTEALQPLAEKVSSGLNEHDLSAVEAGGGKLFPFAWLETGAYYAAYERKAAQSMRLAGGVGFYAQIGVAGVDNTATIADNPEWQPLTDDTTGLPLSKTLSTGEDILCVFAQVQSAGWKGDLGVNRAPSLDEYRLQYAIRIDGVVYEDTITGMSRFPEAPPGQFYNGCAAVSNTADFDYRHIRWQQDGIGLPNHLQPVRMTRTVPVVEGEHTVEIVARRPTRLNGKPDNSGEGSSMQAFNRRLFVLRIKGWSKFSGSGAPTLSIAPWEEGETVSSARLNTARIVPVRNALNNVSEAAIQRGALRSEHLPSVVAFTTMKVLLPTTAQLVCVGATASTYAGYGSAVGWQPIFDGLGNTLSVTGTFVLSPGVMMVLANVQVRLIEDSGIPIVPAWVVAGNFIIRYQDSAFAWNYVAETEVSLTARNQTAGLSSASGNIGPPPDLFNANGSTATMNEIEEDVALMWTFDTAALIALNANASTIRAIEVRCATLDAAHNPQTRSINMATQNASLTMFLLKGVPLA